MCRATGSTAKAMGQRVDYGAWWSYSFQRLGGLELGSFDLFRDSATAPRSSARIRLASFGERRDWQRFADAYADPEAGAAPGRAVRRDGPRRPIFPTCTGPLSYTGHAAIRADIEHFKAALQSAGLDEGFMTSVAPAAAPESATPTTPRTKNFCLPAQTRCARNIARSLTPG